MHWQPPANSEGGYLFPYAGPFALLLEKQLRSTTGVDQPKIGANNWRSESCALNNGIAAQLFALALTLIALRERTMRSL